MQARGFNNPNVKIASSIYAAEISSFAFIHTALSLNKDGSQMQYFANSGFIHLLSVLSDDMSKFEVLPMHLQ